MGYGGSGNKYTDTTTNTDPWGPQGDYMQALWAPLFAGSFGVSRGQKKDEQGELMFDDKGKPLMDFEDIAPGNPWLDRFKGEYAGTKNPLPGQLEYFGDKEGLWGNISNLNQSYPTAPTVATSPWGTSGTAPTIATSPWGTSGTAPTVATSPWGTSGTAPTIAPQRISGIPTAPTIAQFTPEEIAAQDIIKARLRGETEAGGYNTGYDTLIPTATGSLEDVVSGKTKIDPASFDAAQVDAPSAISKPTIDSTDLGYRYWGNLGSMAGGNFANQYLEKMIGNAKENIWNDYSKYGVPGTDNTAEAAGRHGGNTWKELRTDLYDKTAENAGQVETAMRGAAYNTDMNRALEAMNLGGTLATSQAGIDADRRARQAGWGLQAETSQAGNELTRYIQNALLKQEAGKEGAGWEQQANIQNVNNIISGSQIAPDVSQADYIDTANLAAVGESRGSKQQDVIDAYIKRFETNQLEPYQRMSLASNALSGDFGGTTTSRAPATKGGYI